MDLSQWSTAKVYFMHEQIYILKTVWLRPDFVHDDLIAYCLQVKIDSEYLSPL